ncbi:MAG: DUF1365 domain-containing protein [Nitriliruptoraceae bacterium]
MMFNRLGDDVTPVGASGIYRGTVRHRRRRPKPHAFWMRTYHVLVDIDDLPRLDRDIVGFGYNRRAFTTFYDRDHFGPTDRPVREKITDWLAARDLTLPPGRLSVLTNLRVAGHVFNPVSWWFAFDSDGDLAMVLAEVSNTFGDHHVYVLDNLARQPGDVVLRAGAPKVFHVSPFLPIEGLNYRFTLQPPGETVLVHMDVDDHLGKIFDATQTGRRHALTSGELWRAMLRHPFTPLMTVLAIHGHALRLLIKRTPFHRRPEPPDDGFDRPTTAPPDTHPASNNRRRPAA